MGYFNYFIKCVIRKFVNMLFKPKMFLALLIIIGVLFAMNITARAEWTNQQVLDIIDELEYTNLILMEQLNDIEQIKFNTEDLEDIETILSNIDTRILSVNANLGDIQNALNNLGTTTETIRENTFMINSNLIKVINNLNSITTSITDVYNKLDANQKELLGELDKDNQALLEELNMIRESINGTSEELTTFTELDIVYNNNYDMFLKPIMIDYQPRYSYTVKVYYTNDYNWSFDTSVYYSDNIPPLKFSYSDHWRNFYGIGTVPANTSDYVFSFDVPSSNPKYIGFIWGRNISKIEVYRSIKGIVESLNDSNSLQQQQNQLQQQQNQLQQEQNDILTNDNVETDGLEFATDDTVNPTDDGFNTLFMSIYNAFCSTSSQPLTVTLPYVNQTFTIQPNLVSNAMQKMRSRCCSKFN